MPEKCPQEKHLVLVVEDNLTVKDAIKNVLSLKGCEVITAENGFEALQLLRSSSQLPCLIFLDLMMPVMDGWQFLEELRKEQTKDLSSIPVVILSAAAQSQAESAKELSQGYLKKPVKLNDLMVHVQNFCA